MPAPVEVRLTSQEIFHGAFTGVMRQVASLQQGDKHRAGMDEGDAWRAHIEGALGEIAVAGYIGAYWPCSVNQKRGGFADIPPDIEVKTRSDHNYELLVRPGEKKHRRFVLVTGMCGVYRLQGWAYGYEVMQEEFLATHAGRDPAYFYPQAKLYDIRQLFATTIRKREG